MASTGRFGRSRAGSNPAPPASESVWSVCEHTFVRYPRFTEQEARAAIAQADCWSAALRHLGMRVAGGNHKTLQKWAARWEIPTDHFDRRAVRARARAPRKIPLEEVLVENSTYHRGKLKARLYSEGIKERACELCGQGEGWQGRTMSLILDHANGVATDNRIENLRTVCPNCAATLDTHCGRNLRRVRFCRACGDKFEPSHTEHVYCSRKCAGRSPKRTLSRPLARRAERPPYEQLMREIEETNWSAVGRKYGVSDNAVRKWVRAYERDRATARPVPRLNACGAYACSSRLRQSPSSYSWRRMRTSSSTHARGGPAAAPQARR